MYKPGFYKSNVELDEKKVSEEALKNNKNLNLHNTSKPLISGTVNQDVKIQQTFKGSTFTGNVDDILKQFAIPADDNHMSNFKP
ncbi:Uncharacterised protein [Legionella busanensis]|uniref:Uncharacterized protein n=1 Tax=Legionella busanensis TaxID=190655 RepID=A0A378JLZ8_9GAMM|nr:hypothetical protein [Legionella busanensis]STX52107.1 Uncharacterised protein [Legionella busanensis]